MRQYQYHPDGWIYFRSGAGTYCDTPANAATDAQTVLGQAVSLPAPAAPCIGLTYAPGGPLYGSTGTTQSIVTAGDNGTLDTLLGDVSQLLSAQTARNAPPPQTLAQAQAAKIAAIDQKTGQLLAAGFSYTPSGQQTAYTFGLDLDSRNIWHGLYTAAQAGLLTYPVTVGPLTGPTTTLTNAADVAAFFATGLGRCQTVLTGGVDLEAQVQACTTIDQVNAIVDSRT